MIFTLSFTTSGSILSSTLHTSICTINFVIRCFMLESWRLRYILLSCNWFRLRGVLESIWFLYNRYLLHRLDVSSTNCFVICCFPAMIWRHLPHSSLMISFEGCVGIYIPIQP
jgi:hypothetical protein